MGKQPIPHDPWDIRAAKEHLARLEREAEALHDLAATGDYLVTRQRERIAEMEALAAASPSVTNTSGGAS